MIQYCREKPYTELVETLNKHFSPKPSEIVGRFHFRSHYRRQGESVTTFVAELRSLAKHCNFGTTLEAMLRDQIVCGINNETAQKRLLAEPNLDFKKAVELAQALETAESSAKQLTHGSPKPGMNSQDITAVHKTAPAPSRMNKEHKCYRCGNTTHTAQSCRFKSAKCRHCGKVGHIERVCRSKAEQKSVKHPVRSIQEEDEEFSLVDKLHGGSDKTPPIMVSVTVNNQPIEMELDTGAAFSLVSEATFRKLWPDSTLQESTIRLCSYSGDPITVCGSLEVEVVYKSQKAQLALLVVAGNGTTLLGRNWLKALYLDWQEIHYVHDGPISQLLEKHSALFQEGLGTLQGHKVSIHVNSDAKPVFSKARTLPYAYKAKVEQELDRLVKEGILEPVEFAEWASPIVAVLKKDASSIRICGDFKQTVNPVSKLDRYPIPKVEDLFATLTCGQTFSKLDLSQAYQQLSLDDLSKQYVVINTHRGLFRYTCLPYGISSAPGIFQRVMESILQGIAGVIVYIDDILVTGSSKEEHNQRLEEVLSRLEKAGLRLRKDKCRFNVSSVSFLGHKIDKDGLHPLEDKVQAVLKAPTPRNVNELKAFLGLISYYGKFLPNLSSTLAPLYFLLRKDTRWHWSTKEETAFSEAKKLLASPRLLVHFDPSLPLTLACDASAYGIGAVLAHQTPDGTERPIAYASRSLSKAEQNYCQLEKEALSCIFGVKRFYQYLIGHKFELWTDHKSLLALLNEHRSTSPQASARIRRWSLFLAAYKYSIKFRDTTAHANADALSRLPLPTTPEVPILPPELVLLTKQLEDLPVTSEHIRTWSRKDPILSRVIRYVNKGWPKNLDQKVKPYESRKNELSTLDDCLLWGARIVIPPQGQKLILNELHDTHIGMTRMKSLARMHVWWPQLDRDIEQLVKGCHQCQVDQPEPPKAPLQPWSWPSRPWSRLHIDYAGPLYGKMCLN